MKQIFVLSFFCIFLITSYCSSAEKDSLIQLLNKSPEDTSKLHLYHQVIQQIQSENHVLATKYAEEQLALSRKLDQQIHISYLDLSDLYFLNSEYKQSIKYCQLVLKEVNRLPEQEKYDYRGRAYERLSTIYSSLGNHDLAIKYQFNAIESYKKLKGDNYVHIMYLNLANTYYNADKLDKALYFYKVAENRFTENELTEYLSYAYNGMAACYNDNKDYEKALFYFEKSKKNIIEYSHDDKSSLAATLNNIGELYSRMGNNSMALVNFLESYNLFKKLNDKESLLSVYKNLAACNSKIGNYKEANLYLDKYVMLKDSIFDEDTKKTIHDLSIKYESEKKEQENKILSKDNEKKQLSIYFALAGLSLVIVILFIIFRNSRQKSKINKQLEENNKLINRQKLLVEEKSAIVEEQHKDITDSINYAQRIQGAILPPEQKWQQILPKSFVLNKPKDILSGDFYWIADTETHLFVAAADCTGHGVPGALISIVNFNLLNKAVLENDLRIPSEILDSVNVWLNELFHKSDDTDNIKDGMDISLISINKQSNEVLFCGANNPLYHYSGGAFSEYKGNKFPVGAFVGETAQKFTTQKIDVQKGDTIYLFSDGYADQFGGPNGKKFKYKQLQEVLQQAEIMSMPEQKEFLFRVFENWKGKLDQIDDVLIIGLKV